MVDVSRIDHGNQDGIKLQSNWHRCAMEQSNGAVVWGGTQYPEL